MPERVLLRVKVHPQARRNAVGAYVNGVLQVHVTAAPEKGKANENVIALLAGWLELSKGALELKRGAAARTKWIAVAGMTEAELEQRLKAHR